MDLSDFIFTEQCLDKQKCESIIKLYNDNTACAIDATVGHDSLNREFRNNTIMHIGKYRDDNENFRELDEIIFEAINKSFNNYVDHINGLSSKNVAEKLHFLSGQINDEGYMINKYVKNEGLYNWHTDNDIAKSNFETRKISCIIYLNDIEDGGETDFGFMKIKPVCGKILFFPALWTFLHRGCMPLSDDKYIITTWFH